jgi:16S rRNA (guanine527-N7)-methyltransferase
MLSPEEVRKSRVARLQQLVLDLGQAPLAKEQAESLADYIALLLRWNQKMNLTAIRDEAEIERRHLAESILCARMLPPEIARVLDYGSGGGLPGIPCAICLPGVFVTLAESQAKKASFLREAVRSLGLHARVYAGRAEELAGGELYDVVTIRAVDRMKEACRRASLLVRGCGWLAVLATQASVDAYTKDIAGFDWVEARPLPGTVQAVLKMGRKSQSTYRDVPRGTSP